MSLNVGCPRCGSTNVQWKTTGFLMDVLPHKKPDGSQCLMEAVLIEHTLVEVKPMEMPSSLLLNLEYMYGKK